jgi:hypothetical protein
MPEMPYQAPGGHASAINQQSLVAFQDARIQGAETLLQSALLGGP